MLLAVNCGSSSIKYKLFDFPDLKVLIDGSASNVETKGAKPIIKFVVHEADHNEEESEEEKDGMAYDEVFERIITLLETSSSHHFLKPSAPGRARDVVQVIAHRVVHGGAATEPMVIKPNEQEKIDELDKLSAFAPLHNHRAILTIKSCLQHLPNSTQVLLFDTLFHSTIPPHISTYPLAPPEETPPIPLKKYGAHGLSYASVLSSIATHLGKPESQCNLIIAHLGSGASVCVIKNGKSLDTSMGLTPLDGLPGGTRSGSVDPVLIFHHTPGASEEVEAKGVKLSKGEQLLNKQGGLQAVCGTSDFGTIMARITAPGGAEDDRQSAQLAFDLFLDRVLNYLGSYTLKLLGSGNNLDGIVFAGGIGERATQLRESAMGYFKFLGAKPDKERNEAAGKKGGGTVTEISAQGSYPRFFVCKTDEEFQCAKMARDLIDH